MLLNMKRILCGFLLIATTISVFSQAKTPKLMVIPMDIWCQERGFWDIYEDQGVMRGVANYERAVQDSRELILVISKINSIVKERGYSQLADLAQSIRNNQRRSARNNLTMSKVGNMLATSALDELNRQVKADIYVEVDWRVNTMGPKNSVTYNLRALDAYTSEPIAGVQGTGAPSFIAELSSLLEEAVISSMDDFLSQLQNHFDDCIENGRKVTIEIGVFDNASGLDLETEYNGMELREIIEDWMAKYTVHNQFITSESTENILYFEGVRIPLYKENGLPQDANGFVNELRKYLRTTYNIDSKNNSSSLGYAQLIIGEK